MSDSTSTPTVGEMIDRVKELEAYIAKEIMATEERLKPYQQAADLLSGAVKQYLLDNNIQNIKSAEGRFTAYISRPLSVKVIDRERFLNFITYYDKWEFLDARCLKEPVEKLLDENEERAKRGEAPIPPSSLGISAEPVIKCNIRKS